MLLKTYFIPYIYILLFIFSSHVTIAQQKTLYITTKRDQTFKPEQSFPYQTVKTTDSLVRHFIDSISTGLQKEGYVHLSSTLLTPNDSSYIAEFELGQKINFIKIYHSSTLDQFNIHDIKEASVISDTSFTIPYSRIESTLTSITQKLESLGQTFAELSLSNIKFYKDFAEARLNIQKSSPRHIDKIIIKGYEKFPKSYLRYFLDLKEGAIFNATKIKQASKSINQLDFVKELKPPEILFRADSTVIYLYLAKQKSNTFDGIIGFNSKENESGLAFNGYLDLELNNIFNNGEAIKVFWKNNGNESQRLKIAAHTPYIFNSPFIIDLNFEIFRQDTTFRTNTLNLNLGYNINKTQTVYASYESDHSNTLDDTNTSLNIESYKKQLFGLQYNFQNKSDDHLFYNKTFLKTSFLIGHRKNNSITNQQFKAQLTVNHIFKVNVKNFIFIQNQSGWLKSDNYLVNELFRIGGVYNLRGFNEESIYTNLFTVFNLEYRYKPNLQSYFYSITDMAYTENQASNLNHNFLSLGIGYAIQTKLGLINLSYATGKQDHNAFDFKNSNIHIKILSVF